MADVDATLAAWSSTTASNKPTGPTTIGTGLDDNFREIQGVIVRGLSHKGSDIASAATTDLGAVEGLFHDITGTTTITSFGTVRAGIWKVLKFEGALTLTHNATSLIILGGANITTADGDMLMATSEGSGNWRVNWYVKASGSPLPFIDSDAVVRGSADATKKMRFEVDGLTTATTRVVTLADKDITLGKAPTIQDFTSGSGTYTTPSGCTRIVVRMVGGGGGGGGQSATNGTAGSNTTFGSLTAGGGALGTAGTAGAGGAGGTNTVSGTTIDFPGAKGQGGGTSGAGGIASQGGNGGGSSFYGGGGGGGAAQGGAGAAGATNTGGGGGGGSAVSAASSAGGGGGGGSIEAWISPPSATYSYGVGAGGTGGVGSQTTGGDGAAGRITVYEYYD